MKRFVFIILCLLFVNTLFASSWESIKRKYPELDLSRIYEIYEPGSVSFKYEIEEEIMFRRESVTLPGKLLRLRDFSPAQIEAAIQKAFDLSDINNRSQLKNLNDLVRQAKEIDYSNTEFLNDLKTLVGAADGGLASDIIFDILIALESSPKALKSGEAAKDFANYSGEAALQIFDIVHGERELASSFTALQSVKDKLGTVQKLNAYYESWQVIQRAKERQEQRIRNRTANYVGIRLDRFYKILNDALRSTRGNSEWTLRVKGAGVLPYRYEGEDCAKAVSVNMELKKILPHYDDDRRNIAGYEGTYIGWLNSQIVFDMSAWDAHYIAKTLEEAVLTDNISRMMSFIHRDLASKGVMRGYKYLNKGTKAVITMKLPVRMILQKSKDDSELIYSSPHLIEEGEDWVSDDINDEGEGIESPQIEMDIVYQMHHESTGRVTDPESNLSIDYSASEIYYKDRGVVVTQSSQIGAESNITQQPDKVQAFFAAIFNGIFSTEGSSERNVDLSSFTGSPIGTVTIYVKDNIANIDWGSDDPVDLDKFYNLFK